LLQDIKILIVEDDLEINRLITKYLSKEDFKIDSTLNGSDALRLLTTKSYQMVVLDLMMPYIDGYEVLKKIRENNNNVPVLIISAKAENTDKVLGLGLGADDYLTKPFSVEELIARVKAQLRRYLQFNNTIEQKDMILEYKDILMNVNTYEITINGKPIVLTSKEFDILKLLMSNPKKIFTKANVFNTVWGEEYIGDENTIMVHIRRLREKIELEPSNPKYIQTVWGIGYRMSEV
jgi:DNA-binding response OmpR family regulator